MRKLLHWLDDNILFLISSFLLAFIPLFPKLPLFDVLPGYIVRVRLEDFLVVFALVVWLVQLWRKKVSFGPNPLAKPILAYLTVGILSMISAIFITQTVPMESLHIGKMVLHFLRRVEYFSLFFVFYSSIKSLKQVKIYAIILVATILAVTIYGYGQKYFFWPAFSTMNREFSKGWALYLTQHARVLSTFGGHYDLAAYTMIALVFLWALYFSLTKKWLRVVIFIILAGAFWLLILTASRTSFLAYIGGVSLLFFLWAFIRGFHWSITRWLGVITLSMVIMLSFGDLSDRFLKILKLDQRVNNIKNLLLRPIGTPPKGDQIVLLENNIEAVTSKSDFPPLPMKPSDVTYEGPDGSIATISASGAAIIRQIPRTYSQTALVYDLSTGIRLDALWPRAIVGFRRNPLLGTGYSTLTKTQVSEFTEAESTDNDYLRALGETGILGFLTFAWILIVIVWTAWKLFTEIKDNMMLALSMGLIAIVFALLMNAVYIDIFEASKVAFSFWAIAGIILGGLKVLEKDTKERKNWWPRVPHFSENVKSYTETAIKIAKSDTFHLFLILILAYTLRLYKIHEPLADWHSWRQADTSAVTRNFVRYGLNPWFPRYDDLSSIASGQPNPEGYRFVEFPIYNIASYVTDHLVPGYNIEHSGRLTSIIFSLGSLTLLYFLAKELFSQRVAYIAAISFAVLPYNVFWSRVILPEPTLVCLTMGLLYFFYKYVDTEKIRFLVLAGIFGAAALLVKFTAAFFAFPLLYLAWRKWKMKMFVQPGLWFMSALVVVPFFLWRWHISHYPEGIPAYTWLLNGNGIRFKGSWFQWLFFERIGNWILGAWGTGFLVLGLIRRISRTENEQKNNWFLHFWGLGLLLYLVVFATGNVQHDYYQIILVPFISLCVALGIDWILESTQFLHKRLSFVILLVISAFTLAFGWYQVRDLYNINHREIVEAGREFDRLIDNRNVTVIAPYGGDTAFLYQTGRRGWPLMEGTIEEMIEKGAHYYTSVNYDDLTNELIAGAKQVEEGLDAEHEYKIIAKTEKYAIIQLVSDKRLPPK